MSVYPEYKECDGDWIKEIPVDWDIVRGKYLFEIKKRIVGEVGHNVLSITQKGIKVKDTESGDGQLSMDYSKYQIVQPGDFAMNHMDLLTGYVDISKFNGVTSPDYRVFTAKKEAGCSRFFLYLFQMGYSNKIFFKYGQGASHLGRWRLPTEEFNNFCFPCPPKEGREQIADFLDHEIAKIDSLIEKQQQLIKLLKEKRQTVINHAVTKGLNPNGPMRDSGVEWLGEVPENWGVAKVKYFASIQGGYAFSSDSFQDSGVQLLRIGNMYLNRLALERQPTFVDESLVKTRKDFSVKRGDILMSLTGTLGKTDYGFAVHVNEDGPFMLNQRVAKITPIESKIAPEYLIYAIRSESYLKQLYSLPSGTKQANLSNDNVINIPIVVPPTIEEQLLVAKHVSDNLQKYNRLINKSETAVKLIQERRTALISAAVTGKIDVRHFASNNGQTPKSSTKEAINA